MERVFENHNGNDDDHCHDSSFISHSKHVYISWCRYVVVLHCGGTTVVGSVVEIAGGLLTVKESITSSSVAGDSLTNVLVQHFAKEFYT